MTKHPLLPVCVALALLLAAALPAAEAEDAGAQGGANEIVPPALLQGLDWRLIGPFRGGRVTAVAGVVQSRTDFYMGASGGGVWKSGDLGTTWRNVSDGYFDVASIGAIDVADSDPNVVYVGTGSACIRSNVMTGRGVYKSTDAGDTWRFVGLPEAGAIGDVVVDPRDAETVFVAALGHPFGPNPERGVYRSRDGGATWHHVLSLSPDTGAVDLAMDPSNPRHLLAALWTARRKPWTIVSGSQESGLYRTTDGGDSWQKVTQGLPRGLVGKIAVEVSPARGERVWALVEAPGEGRGLYRSDDAGESFELVSSQPSLTYRPFYYMHLTADPHNPDKLYVNNETLWVTTDGGRSFQALRTPHGDNHDLWIHPRDPRLMVQGNDGGANVSWDGGHTWSPQWNQPTAELYQVEVDSRFPYRVYGAQQDNTTISVPSKVSRRPLDPKQNWLEVSGCETGPVVVHPEDPDLVYGGCKGRHSVYDHRTGQVRQYWVYPHYNYGHDTREMPYRFQRTAPLIVSPHDPRVLYHGSHVVHRSRDGGVTWNVVSPDLTAFDDATQGYSGEPITHDITGEEVYSALYALAESPHREGVLWAGSNDGPIHRSLDGGATWDDVTPADLPPGGRVNRIEPSPHRAGRVYVSVYRFRLDDFAPYVYRSDDWGRSWRRLTDGKNGIPANHPVRVVREDPDREGLLYAGTEFGIFLSVDGGAHWQSLQLDLPVTAVTDIKVHRQDLVVSTMGRSFWILDDLTPLHQFHHEVTGAEAHLFAPRPAHRARWVGSLERSFPGYAPEYPATGALLRYWLGSESGDELTLEILDSEGNEVRRYRSGSPGEERDSAADGMRRSGSGGAAALDTSAGLHAFVWDLRHEPPMALGPGRRLLGPLAVPATYQVRLTRGSWSATRTLELHEDPRVKASGVAVADLETQLRFVTRMVSDLDRLRGAVKKIRDARSQLQDLSRRMKGSAHDEDGAISAASRRLVAELTALEELLVQTTPGKVGAELEPQLDSQLTYLYGMVTQADQAPGRDAFVRLEHLEDELEQHLQSLQSLLRRDLAELNALLRERRVPAVVLLSPT